MAWSTRELAELAGTTVNTIRHYHRLGLLDQPERRYNGYKQYGVPDLVHLLRIRRLAALGIPLARIGEVAAGGDRTHDVLRALDAELAASIERRQRARADIAAILPDSAPADVPAGFESVASRLSQADRSIVHIYTRFYDEDALSDLRRMIEADTDTVGDDINAMPADADEATRQRLAERLAPILARNLVDYPWLSDPAARFTKSEHATRQTIIEALIELYNPAQIDVLRRAGVLAHERLRAASEASEAVDDTDRRSPPAGLDRVPRTRSVLVPSRDGSRHPRHPA
ncbi:MerR family transcriptional regulator [Nocardiopsis mangrovi]|uniref:MerR family transcriptional regulator n=1 Tax=Nocardiopsis mangrovi TaxID=1179818 RepID=A0ABV9E4I3_9ACTN